ncbi:MAG: tRNA 2-thiouridine(34) synthase MnmA [Candidatus Sumerlaeia bacterium]
MIERMIESLERWRGRRVAVAMSGGVDSSLAASLLARAGAEVVGVHMRTQPSPPGEHARDARAVAASMGFEFHDFDLSEMFRGDVVDPFIDDYLAGRTPNPCAICNRRLKFGALLDRALSLGAEAIATGHYARVRMNEAGRCELYRAADGSRDQTYFLFGLGQEQLRRAIFPLGDLKKSDVRELARELGLEVADKPDSVEICFIPGNDYRRFLAQEAGERLEGREGVIVNASGEVLGRHAGAHNFTIGQRKGLGIAAPRPLYVVGIDNDTQTVTVGYEEELLAQSLTIERVNWVSLAPQAEPLRARVRIRYRSPGFMGMIFPEPDGRARIEFDEPVRAITPGQAAVAYDDGGDERVLFGGWIRKE